MAFAPIIMMPHFAIRKARISPEAQATNPCSGAGHADGRIYCLDVEENC